MAGTVLPGEAQLPGREPRMRPSVGKAPGASVWGVPLSPGPPSTAAEAMQNPTPEPP